MKRADFHYHLPEHLIAQYPTQQRTQSRLMHLCRQSGTCQHRVFQELPDLLHPGDLLIFNNTRVIPARLYGRKQTGGAIELLIERLLNEHSAWAHIKASKAPQIGAKLSLDGDVICEVVARKDGLFCIKFTDDVNILELLKKHGEIPLPPYISRAADDDDVIRYQTVYAEKDGAVAAPTAGLHFDTALLDTITAKQVQTAQVTLHVGAGTFQPVRVENIKEHQMHHEFVEIDQAVCDRIIATKAAGHRVIAVGTTVVRTLESAAQLSHDNALISPLSGDTNIFIYPGYEFKIIDGLITNFHLPESTLLMLVSAFASSEAIIAAYATAVEKQYRFFSYGDAMLIT